MADPRKEKLGEAIQAMEEVVKGTDAKPEDSFTLAKLYLKKGDWVSYGKRMHGVLGAQKGAVPLEQTRVLHRTLLERMNLDDANTWLKTWRKPLPTASTRFG